MWMRPLGSLFLIVAIACLALLAASEWTIRRGHEAALRPVPVPHDAASVAEGARLATLVGCRSCHGEGKGAVWTPVDWTFGQIAPPALARTAAGYSDAEFARLIRHGLRKDGSSVFIMPAWSMANLADDDVGRIIAWVRTLKPASDDVIASTWFGPLGRWQIVTGALRPSFEVGDVGPPARPADPGRYFTLALCSECHKLQEAQVHDGNKVPALAPVAASYSLPDFQRLLHTGVGAGGRDSGFMGTIAKENLHALSDSEIAVIHAYLSKEAKP
ncbi:MAG: c-type cytochrome [Sphingomonas sp.]|nr:c-type cytochrome [Sphingomonas sp.]